MRKSNERDESKTMFVLKGQKFQKSFLKQLITLSLIAAFVIALASCYYDSDPAVNNDSEDTNYDDNGTQNSENDQENNDTDDVEENETGDNQNGNGDEDDAPSDAPSDNPSDDPIDDPVDQPIEPELSPSQGLAYRIIDGTVTITGMGDCTDYDIVIPSEINGYPVTAIGEHAFEDAYYDSVVIPNCITDIGRRAFFGTRIKSLTIPESVKRIGEYAFYNCYYLEEIRFNAISINDLEYRQHTFYSAGRHTGDLKLIIGNKVERIPARIFEDSEITSVEFEERSVCREIGELAIEGIYTSIILPDSVTSFAVNAFNSQNLETLVLGAGITQIETALLNSGIKNIILGNNVTSILDSEYSGDYQMERNVYGGCNYVGSKENPYLVLVDVLDKSLETYTIHKDTRLINHSAFYSCTSLVTINIPEGVTFIGNEAFYNCLSLTEVVIGGSASIGERAFYYCQNLQTVTFGGSVSLADVAFGECTKLRVINGSEKVAELGSSAFYSCPALESFTIGSDLTHIGDDAFNSCTSLSRIDIPSNVISIGNHAFYNSGLESVTIDVGLSKLSGTAFDNCQKLTWNEYGNCYYAGNADSMYAILIQVKPMYYGHYVYSVHEDTVLIADEIFHQPGVYFHSISVADGNKIYKSINGSLYTKDGKTLIRAFTLNNAETFAVPDGVETIQSFVFSGNTTLTSVSIPNSVTSIGSHAFKDCTNIVNVQLSNRITAIEEYTFFNCKSLTDIKLDGVTSIGDDAFHGCSGLTAIVGTDHVTSIGEWSFSYCTGLRSITIPAGVTSIGSAAFNECTGLEVIYFDAVSMEDLPYDNNVFYHAGADASGIKLVIDAGVTRIPAYLFGSGSYGVNVTSIEFEENGVCKSIGRNAFYGCRYISEIYYGAVNVKDLSYEYNVFSEEGTNDGIKVVIGKSVEKIPAFLFNSATNITSIVFESGSVCKQIGEGAFRSSNIESIVIPQCVTEIQRRAFELCDFLTSIVLERTEGWWITQEYTATSGIELTAIELSAPATAADYLKSTYAYYYWHCE